jgi:hypothetical protein
MTGRQGGQMGGLIAVNEGVFIYLYERIKVG